MRHKAAYLLGLLSLFVVFTGDSCLLEQRTVHTVVGGDIPVFWTTTGYAENSDTRMVNAASDLNDALDQFSDDSDLESVHISGVSYEVLENRGSAARHMASRTGSVTVDGLALLDFNVPDTEPGTTGNSDGADIILHSAGLDHINSQLDDYLAGYNSGSPDTTLLQFTFVTTWSSVPAPTMGDPEDFDWNVGLFLQVVGTVTLDVPNP